MRDFFLEQFFYFLYFTAAKSTAEKLPDLLFNINYLAINIFLFCVVTCTYTLCVTFFDAEKKYIICLDSQ